MRDQLRTAIRATAAPVRVVVLDLSATHHLDLEGLDILAGLHQELQGQGIGLRIVGLHTRALELLRADGIAQGIGESNFYRTVSEAMQEIPES